MLYYFICAILMLAVMLVYFKLADRYNIIDKPNERSSHSSITIRGGGIIFPVAALLWFFVYGFQQPYMIAGLLAMSVVSFLDDVLTLSSKIRILVHLVAVSLLFCQLQLFGLHWYIVLVAYIFTIGWINAFNFMDGINGITVLYAMVALITFAFLNLRLPFTSSELLILLILAGIIFGWFNMRTRARCFAGDVGSVSLAFLLAWFMLSLIMHTGRPEYILFFSLYAIDSVFTIIHRLMKRENIFQAHRTHLYQYLSNEMGWPHVWVSVLYALVQLSINALVIILVKMGIMNLWLAFALLAGLSAVYLVFRVVVLDRIQRFRDLRD